MLPVARAVADRASVEEALARRRHSHDGGAYTLLLDEGGAASGPLANVPIAIKDLINVAGHPTRCGSAVRADAPAASADAPVVASLRRAGARLVGKTALHEFAFGATGVNDYEGTPRNPHDPSRIAGGSSSGSGVAVAEGSASAALGTDTGGSVRIPAALCGVVGVKPSYGLIPVAGVFPLAPSLDHVGVLAADVASARAVLGVLTKLADAPAPRRIGVDRRALAECAPEVRRAIEDALRRLGVALVDVTLPDADAIVSVTTAIMFPEAALVHRATLASQRERYGAAVRERLERGMATLAVDHIAARVEATSLRARVAVVLDSVDAVAGPTVGITAPTIEEARQPDVSNRLVRYTRLWNAVGFPAVSLPVPSRGLPVGLQLVARDDAQALAAASAVEAALR